MKVQWRRGSRIKVKAEEAFQVLSEIHERDGKVTPPAVVEEARPEESVLHPEFEWQDEVAAEKFREQQAASLIRALVVVREDAAAQDEKPQQMRVFIRPVAPVETEKDPYKHLRGKGSYSLTDDVLSDPVLRHQFLARAWQEMKQFRARYQALAEFAAIFEAMESTEKVLPEAVGF